MRKPMRMMDLLWFVPMMVISALLTPAARGVEITAQSWIELAMVLSLFMIPSFVIFSLHDKNDALQTQIDDLKRELEEVKGKMKE